MNQRRSARRLFARLGLLFGLCLASCHACGERRSVAELLETHALVERDFAAARATWSAAELGARFNMGDGLRTGPAASAILTLTRGGRVLVKSDTIMRFMRSPAGSLDADIEVAAGELTVETGEVDLGIRTARGLVKLARGSVVKVNAQSDKIRFDVAVGRAEHEAQASALSAQAGGGFDVLLLPVSVEKAAATQPVALNAVAPRELDAGRLPDAKSGSVLRDLELQASPPSASVTLRAGESVTVHDPAAASDVRTLVTHCPADAVWEFDGGNGRFDALRVHGTGELRAHVPLGAYRHRVRCVRDGRMQPPAQGSGRLQVLRDAARRPLPTKSVSITADADGRRYTVSYQNRLPIITLRWPDAPRSSQYTLTVWPEHAPSFSIQAKQASVTLPEERLGDGLHRFEFAANGVRSEAGLLGVTFDYRARTAYLTSPVEGQGPSSAAGSMRFSGGTLLGSSVSVQGTALALDSQGRFSADVALPVGSSSVAVRVVHKTTGVHYYVRHWPAVPP